MTTPLVSCLCVTEARPEFMPWLLWNFDRQTYARRELVIVDSSVNPFQCDRPDVRVVHAAVGSNIPAKRNRALGLAQGSIVAWFDDDDWQHPERLQRLVAALGAGYAVAGVSQSWFVDVFSGRGAAHPGRGRVLFNGAGFAAGVARSLSFNERLRRGSDTIWLRALRAAGHVSQLLDPGVLSAWLCHDRNITNPRSRREFAISPGELASALGVRAWTEAEAELELLRARLEEAARRVSEASYSSV